jgi:hypothetical protein
MINDGRQISRPFKRVNVWARSIEFISTSLVVTPWSSSPASTVGILNVLLMDIYIGGPAKSKFSV